jgi:hypothetical protein
MPTLLLKEEEAIAVRLRTAARVGDAGRASSRSGIVAQN